MHICLALASCRLRRWVRQGTGARAQPGSPVRTAVLCDRTPPLRAVCLGLFCQIGSMAVFFCVYFFLCLHCCCAGPQPPRFLTLTGCNDARAFPPRRVGFGSGGGGGGGGGSGCRCTSSLRWLARGTSATYRERSRARPTPRTARLGLNFGHVIRISYGFHTISRRHAAP